MVLHGTYDHGKIIIIDKIKPDICSNIEIIFLDEDSVISEKSLKNALKLDTVSVETKKWRFDRDEIYSNV